MSSLVTDDTNRKRSGSDESTDSNTSTRAVSNYHHDIRTREAQKEYRYERRVKKDEARFRAVWREADDEEKKLIREIIIRGGKIRYGLNFDLGRMSLYEKWKMLRKYATKEEKEKIMKVWYRTAEGRLHNRRKEMIKHRKAQEGLRF